MFFHLRGKKERGEGGREEGRGRERGRERERDRERGAGKQPLL